MQCTHFRKFCTRSLEFVSEEKWFGDYWAYYPQGKAMLLMLPIFPSGSWPPASTMTSYTLSDYYLWIITILLMPDLQLLAVYISGIFRKGPNDMKFIVEVAKWTRGWVASLIGEVENFIFKITAEIDEMVNSKRKLYYKKFLWKQ